METLVVTIFLAPSVLLFVFSLFPHYGYLSRLQRRIRMHGLLYLSEPSTDVASQETPVAVAPPQVEEQVLLEHPSMDADAVVSTPPASRAVGRQSGVSEMSLPTTPVFGTFSPAVQFRTKITIGSWLRLFSTIIILLTCIVGINLHFISNEPLSLIYFISVGVSTLLVLFLWFMGRKAKVRYSFLSWIFWLFEMAIGVHLFVEATSQYWHLILAVECFLASLIESLTVHCQRDHDMDVILPVDACDASLFETWTFGWCSRLFQIKAVLSMAHIGLLPSCHSAASSIHRLMHIWQQKSEKQQPLMRVLRQSLDNRFILSAAFKLVADGLALVLPLLLWKMIEYLEEPTEDFSQGFIIAGFIFGTNLVYSVFNQRSLYDSFACGMQIKAGATALVYHKVLKLSPALFQEESHSPLTQGQVVSLMTVDVDRLVDLFAHFHILWIAPLQMIGAFYLLYLLFGSSAWAGLLIMFLVIPLNGALGRRIQATQADHSNVKDNRLGKLNEWLFNVRQVKMLSLERLFREKIALLRTSEMEFLLRIAKIMANQFSFFNALTCLNTFATFVAFALSTHQQLGRQKIFVGLALFNIFLPPLILLPTVLIMLSHARVSLTRLIQFLSLPEVQSMDQSNPNKVQFALSVQDHVTGTGPDDLIQLENASFSWQAQEHSVNETVPLLEVDNGKIVLHDLTFTCRKGTLTAIVGSVGSGKSTCLNALLGHLHLRQGKAIVKGRIAFVPQKPFLMQSTVRENITFGREGGDYSEYRQVLHQCALLPDVSRWAAGDETPLGLNGSGLSGGQQQRVSLARAVYSKSDIYLLDDCLSAVDADVAQQLMDRVIGPTGALKFKTRLFVTHALKYLPVCDQIIVLRHGRILACGSYSQLCEQDQSPFCVWLREQGQIPNSHKQDKEQEDVQITEAVTTPEKPSNESKFSPMSELSKENDQEIIPVSHRFLYKRYFMTFSERKLTLVMLLLYILGQGITMTTHGWMTVWALQSNNASYTAIYACLVFFQTIFYFIQNHYLLTRVCYTASVRLHEIVLNHLFQAPMGYFEANSIGRLLQRFERDLVLVDEQLPRALNFVLRTGFNAIGLLLIISFGAPLFLVAVLPILILYFLLQKRYVFIQRQLHALHLQQQAPVLTHLTLSLNGIETIRAYRQTSRFARLLQDHLECVLQAYYPNMVLSRWLGSRLDFLGAILVLLVNVSILVQHYFFDHSSSGSSWQGLSMTMAMQVTATLTFMVIRWCDMDSHMVSLQRLNELTLIASERNDSNESHRDLEVPLTIQFDNVHVRYLSTAPLALEGIQWTIRAGQRVAVVGRTAAGKSTLLHALIRLVPIEKGAIYLNQVNIEHMDVNMLRQSMAILSQDALVWSGSVRENLDPFNRFNDSELLFVLDRVHLSHLQLDESLRSDSLSSGQRQLLCLARALLLKDSIKLLLIDEATSFIDFETESLVKDIVEDTFEGITMITVAHRLRTVMNMDEIVVLDKGQIKEKGSPKMLLQQSQSLFRKMAQENGLLSSVKKT